MRVKIPAGVDDGMRVRVPGEGEDGDPGAPSGDLYIFLSMEPHPLFRREEDDLICQIPISFPQAALGEEIEVPTIDSTTRVEIPRGTQTGDTVRLRSSGLPHVRGRGSGDQIVQFVVKTPTRLTSRQEELLREFAKDEEGKPSKGKGKKRKKLL